LIVVILVIIKNHIYIYFKKLDNKKINIFLYSYN